MKILSTPQKRAVCYADVFDYCLTFDESKRFQIKSSKIAAKTEALFFQSGEYIYIQGKKNNIKKTKIRKSISKKKLVYAKTVARKFYRIPTLKSFAVTGTVAAGNAKLDDDIDCLLITKTGWLWTTRLLVILISELHGLRRRPDANNIKDKLCFNMFIDRKHLAIPKKEQDVFSANELARIKVLWSKNGTEQDLWNKNRWITTYLPKVPVSSSKTLSTNTTDSEPFIEMILKRIQLWYMSTKRTNEVIRDGYVRFHPHDAREWILEKYQAGLRNVGLE